MRRYVAALLLLLLLLAGALFLFAAVRAQPQDLPWTPLDLGDPIGRFTGRKLARLTHDFPHCRALLDRAGVGYAVRLPVGEGACRVENMVRLGEGGARRTALDPGDVGIACPVAAALVMWEWDVVQPAARRYFGRRVRAIEHLGSYSCRRIAGNPRFTGWSQHATANALDIAAFRLDDGTRISVRADWKGEGARARFLREVRSGACGVFATVLSPDYNAAHADHLHLDVAPWAEFGWRGCH